MSETAEAGKDGANLSLLSNLKKLQLSSNGESQQPLSSLIYPSNQFLIRKPLLHLVQASALSSKITVHPDGQITFMGTAIELKDLLSVVSESYLSKSSQKGEKQSMLVPHCNCCSLNCRLVSRELPSEVEGETGGRGEMVEIDHGIEGEESDEGVIDGAVSGEEFGREVGVGEGRGKGLQKNQTFKSKMPRFRKRKQVYTKDLEVPLVMSAKI
ncbi:uncharacterized protein LOC111241259 [Vigna radiata var. radiata]|uniref:Uncharacterized protein LOC111241259 n=1 Tax=Vigna radiata var. radiata TaxID=3916 RepID=A0A3Q0EQU9_VIGRR|nr:uncharacterized protein LOC111241259 [Vigna radiata var. radiata]XP_022634074.1 uncharacterized protein LOC111241259 [Vigna radiata var. radiata]XP_022634075.1 uncharacterized protein LOC111241259 [Vigna radiata var. radiata]